MKRLLLSLLHFWYRMITVFIQKNINKNNNICFYHEKHTYYIIFKFKYSLHRLQETRRLLRVWRRAIAWGERRVHRLPWAIQRKRYKERHSCGRGILPRPDQSFDRA